MNELTNKELLEQIKPLLKDDNYDVRYSAIDALRSILQAKLWGLFYKLCQKRNK